MGLPQADQPPVQLFFAIMATTPERIATCEEKLAARYGTVAMRDEAYAFDPLTDYYAREFGVGLVKRLVAMERLMAPEALVDVKLDTNALEAEMSGGQTAPRVVNVDPGYLNHSKVVLASTKDHYHRIYIGRGIFEEITLTYRRNEGGFLPFEWTYPDYRQQARREFLGSVRERYAERIRGARQ